MRELIRVRGRVQGVGFRPTVSRLAAQLGLPGWVMNDADGVLIALGGDAPLRQRFVHALLGDLPPLAQVQEIVRESAEIPAAQLRVPSAGFTILRSSATHTAARAQVVPDAALCDACAAEVLDPQARRFRYPFTNCTHCGPRFSIAQALPWDRAHTSMAGFALCQACRAEYARASDRRYHAEPIACPDCGPRVQLARMDGMPFAPNSLDAVDAVASLLLDGAIVAVKGVGGYQLLADATQTDVVERLRSRKRRPDKPFALMARDLAQLSSYCEVSAAERTALLHSSAPIVLLQRRSDAPDPALSSALLRLPPSAALRYGFMLPTTPLHLLALRGMSHPVVCTSGNRSEEPQVIDDAQVHTRLGDIADWVLRHDRPIHNCVDDSVVRVFGGQTRVLRRARGLAPAARALPQGFEAVATREAVFAAGADLKAAICLSRAHDLVLSQHLGDLDDAASFMAYAEQSQRLCALFEHRPTCIAIDNHPESRATRHAAQLAQLLNVPLLQVPHHHAHFAACLGDNNVPLSTDSLFGLVLDGIGVGTSDDGRSLWGCELFAGGYTSVERLGTLLPTALPGGDRAAREPWRCLYAQLQAAASPNGEPWHAIHPPLAAALRSKPVELLDQLQHGALAPPRASSCGRLFDAVAAALSICFDHQSFEAQAAQALEALVTPALLAQAARDPAYSLPLLASRDDASSAPLMLDPRPLWPLLLADLARGTPPGLIAAHFHVALAASLAQLCAAAAETCERAGRSVRRAVALSGGCLQNAVLHERLSCELGKRGFSVLTHADIPANDGGIAFGQALIALARSAPESRTTHTER